MFWGKFGGAGSTYPLFMTDLLLSPLLSSSLSLSTLLTRLQIGGCKMTNVTGVAIGGLGLSPNTLHLSLWLKDCITEVGEKYPCLNLSLNALRSYSLKTAALNGESLNITM